MVGFHRQRRRTRRAQVADNGAKARQSAQEGIPTPADVAAKRRPPIVDADPNPAEVATTPTADPDEAAVTAPTGNGESQPAERDAERGLRGLLGSGSSQVSVSAAARARDAARPTEEEIARAERELTIVRRKWVPREPFRPGGNAGRR